MRLGLTLAMGAGIDTALVLEAERLGYSAVWCGESYGSDAVSPIAWVLARTSRIEAGTGIMQMPARTPRLRRHDGDDAAASLRRPLSLRHRALRPAGGGGLARPALRHAAGPHAGVHLHHPRDRVAGEAAGAPWGALPDPL